MVKYSQTIPPLLPTNCLSMFDHFVGLALTGITWNTGNKLFLQVYKIYQMYMPQTFDILSVSKVLFLEHYFGLQRVSRN